MEQQRRRENNSSNSNKMLFQSESMIEDNKWDSEIENDQAQGNSQKEFGKVSSRRSSNGGFFHGKIKHNQQ